MAPSRSPRPHKGSLKALAGYTHWQARGTWEPRLALQEQCKRLRAGVSGVLSPFHHTPELWP